MKQTIPFIDLESQYQRIKSKVDAAVLRVLAHGTYIMGPEIQLLEKQLSAFTGAKHAISCANGTDALILGLMAKNVKPGDAVLVPSFTFAATAEVVAFLGATPLFVDVLPDTFNMDPESLKKGVLAAKKHGLRPVGVITVDLFGQAADYASIGDIAKNNGLWIMADCAQSFGATYQQKSVCGCDFFDIATTSFFPAKPLGCYGDGGAVFTNDDQLAALMKSYRVHGQGSDKYDNERIGLNARLDTIQASILIEKLAIFPDEIKARNTVAERYNQGLSGSVQTPFVRNDCLSVWAQYTLLLSPKINRSHLIEALKAKGIPSVVYYPKPLHQQKGYKHFPCANDGHSLPVSESLSANVFSLPMSAYVTNEQVDFIVDSVKECINTYMSK